MIGTMKAELVRAILMGSVLIVLGLVPGLFQRLQEGIQNLSESLRSPFSRVGVQHKTDHGDSSRSLGLVLLGLGMILLGLLSYVSR